MIVSRPYVDARHVLDVGTFTRSDGLVGDNWPTRGSSGSADGSALLDAHLTLINRRFLDLISDGDRSRWPLAGDQVVVDLEIGHDNLATGDRLTLGTAIVEVTAKPHTGCIKFVRRHALTPNGSRTPSRSPPSIARHLRLDRRGRQGSRR